MNGYQLKFLERLMQLLGKTINMKRNLWLHFHPHEMPFIMQKWNIMVNLDRLLEGNITFLLWVYFTFLTQPDVCQPKLWHLLLLVSKVSSSVFNIWLVTLITLSSRQRATNTSISLCKYGQMIPIFPPLQIGTMFKLWQATNSLSWIWKLVVLLRGAYNLECSGKRDINWRTSTQEVPIHPVPFTQSHQDY